MSPALASLATTLLPFVPTLPTEPAPPTDTRVDEDLQRDVAAYLQRAHEAGLWSGAALVRFDGRDVFRGVAGPRDAGAKEPAPNRPDTVFRVGSITKLFTQVALLRLADRGEVELEASLSEYLPEAPADVAGRVTLRQLLNFHSGLPSELDDAGTGVEYDDHGLARPFLERQRPAFLHEPGERSAYSNLGYWYLGAVIEAVTGASYLDALQDLVLGPLELEDTGYDEDAPGTGRSSNGHEATSDGTLVPIDPYPVRARYASGMLSSTLADLERFCDGVVADGFLTAASREELYRAFRLDRREVTLEGGPVLKGAGFVPGWRSYLRFHPREGHLVILLNNRNVFPPQAIGRIGVDCVNLLRGKEARPLPGPVRAPEMTSAADGLPDTDLARAARAFVDAVGGGEVEDVVAWHAEFMPEMQRADVERHAAQLLGMPARLGGWELVTYREAGRRRFTVGVRGEAPVDVLFTFTAGSTEPLRIEDLGIDQVRR